MPKKKKRTYILDTNVPLHDPHCCQKFEEHNIVIPIPVLEEIDKFKNGMEGKNFNAREFTRFLDDLSPDRIFNGGISLGKGQGTIRIETGVEFSDEFKKSFKEDTMDHRIIAIAYELFKKGENIVLVSKDINVRLKAGSLGIPAEDYRNDTIKNTSILENEIKEISEKEAKLMENLKENQLFKCHEGLRRWNKGQLKKVKKEKYSNIEARNIEQTFALDALADKNISLVAITGIAGSGKTLLSIASAIAQGNNFGTILVARPIVQLSGKDVMGFLPGDKLEKVNPYMEPIYDNIDIIRKGSLKEYHRKDEDIEKWMQEENIKVAALAYIRGRSIVDTFFIIDEAQNLTPHEIKTIITRAGEDTKIVLTGDLSQIDSPYLDEKSSGLAYLIDRFTGQPEFVHINLKEGERSPLADKASRLL